jgi:hypothetical protein
VVDSAEETLALLKPSNHSCIVVRIEVVSGTIGELCEVVGVLLDTVPDAIVVDLGLFMQLPEFSHEGLEVSVFTSGGYDESVSNFLESVYILEL